MSVAAATPTKRSEPSQEEVKRAAGLGFLESALAQLDRAQERLHDADAPLPCAFASTARTYLEHAITAAR